MADDSQEGKWSNRSLLKKLKNPENRHYVIRSDTSELTFLGVPNQPDFAYILVEFTPNEHVIELRSLKEYFVDFRNRTLSYERLISVIFRDLMEVYKPHHLRITMKCNPRGGIASELAVDSDTW